MSSARIGVAHEAFPARVSRMLLLFATCMLIFASLMDPADTILHLKVPAFILLIVVWLARRGLTGETSTIEVWAITVTLALVIPLFATLVGVLHHGVHSSDAPLALFKSFLFLLITPVLISEDIDLTSLIVRMGFLVAIVTLVMIGINLFSNAAFLVLYEFTMEKQNAIITESREVFGLAIGQFYYKTSPLMIFPLAFYCWRWFRNLGKSYKLIWMPLLFGAAILCSGARANVLASIFVVGALALALIQRSRGWPATLVFGGIGIVVIACLLLVKGGDTQETSNAIKLAHAQSYASEFNTNWQDLLFGEGAETGFYTEGFRDWTTVTELSFFELVRVFGIPMTLLFASGLIWLAYRLFRGGSYPIAVAYAAYIAISGSNPLLVSSTGLIVISAAWKEVVRRSGPDSAFHLKWLD